MSQPVRDAAGAIAEDLPFATATIRPAEAKLEAVSGLLLAILAGLAALGTLATNILLPSLPSIAKSFGVPTAATGSTMSAFFATFALGQLVAGPLSDRYGRRKIVFGGLVVFVAGSLCCVLAPTLPLLVAGRVVQAIGVCAASVLSRAIARDLFSGAVLGRVLAFIMVAMAAAPGFSPLLGGALDNAFGWRASFLLVAVFGLGVAAAYAAFVGETHLAERIPLDPLSIARGYGRLARDRRFMAPAATVALIMGGLFALFTISPAILIDGLGFSPMELGLFFAGTVFIVFGAGILAPRLAARSSAPAVTRLGLIAAFAGGAALLGLTSFGFLSFSAFLVPILLFLFGMGLINPLASAIALTPFGDRAGLASALLGFLQMGGAAIGITVATMLPVAPVVALGIVLAALTVMAIAVFFSAARTA